MTDFDAIRRDYPLPQIVQASGIKLEKNGREFKACCPFHAEKSASFTLFTGKTGYWKFHCYGCGVSGDVIDYVKERYGVDQAEAIKQITGQATSRDPLPRQAYIEASDPYDGYDIGRPPPGEPPIYANETTPPILNPKRVDQATGKPKTVTYKPTLASPYRTRKGDLIGYVLRVEIDGKKITPGVWWTRNKAAKFEGWSHGSFPEPRPLYGLEDFDVNPDWQILIVEGEKCKDAAKRVLAGKRVIPASWMGGGKSISKVHWKSLAGRSVIIWPDNDEEGWKTTLGHVDQQGRWRKGIVEYAYEAGAAAVKIVHITRDSRPSGWDIADAEAEGLGQRGVELIMRDRIKAWSKQDIERHKQKELEAHERGGQDDGANEDAGGNEKASQPDIHGGSPSGDRDGREAATAAHTDDDAGSRDIARPSGRGYDISAEDWRNHLIMKADGEGLKANSLQNCALLLQYDRRFAGIFAWNEFAKEVYLQRRPPWDMSGTIGHWRVRKMTEPDVISATCWLEYCGMSPKSNEVGKVIQRVAQHNVYNPVVERMQELRWDGVPRLSGNTYPSNNPEDDDERIEPWLTRYLGADDTPENRAFARRWMIGAVARAFEPGCKMDTMLILEGAQGLKKSTALRILSDAIVPGVFTDEISDPNSKDAGMQMQGAFIIEISELDAFRRSDVSQIKAWLSRQTDRFRRPYGKIVEEFPRSCVFAGTVNPTGGGYLKDASGARRMWPVRCHEIDLDGLRKAAPQLWAEAVAAYRDGERWWLDEEEQGHAAHAQEGRYEEDPYNEMIDNYLVGRNTTNILDILRNALEIPPERRNALAAKRVATHLFRRGWRKVQEGDKVYYQNPSSLGV
jgi:predicted P-loop ATPase